MFALVTRCLLGCCHLVENKSVKFTRGSSKLDLIDWHLFNDIWRINIGWKLEILILNAINHIAMIYHRESWMILYKIFLCNGRLTPIYHL
jgi:hypothetical protein